MSVQQNTLDDFIDKPGLLQRLGLFDWIWALLVIAGSVFVFTQYSAHMDIYEQIILALSAPALIAFGWSWRPMQVLTLVVTALSLLGIWLYGGNNANAEVSFGLRFLVSSQSAVMWMSALFVLATVFYFAGLLAGSEFIEKQLQL